MYTLLPSRGEGKLQFYAHTKTSNKNINSVKCQIYSYCCGTYQVSSFFFRMKLRVRLVTKVIPIVYVNLHLLRFSRIIAITDGKNHYRVVTKSNLYVYVCKYLTVVFLWPIIWNVCWTVSIINIIYYIYWQCLDKDNQSYYILNIEKIKIKYRKKLKGRTDGELIQFVRINI